MPAFNVCSLEMARACIQAAEEENAPVMLQTYPGDLEQASPIVMAAMIKALAEEASVPIILHLDHGDSLERIVRCLRAGYASVMFDGADYPLEENVARTKRLSELAHAAGGGARGRGGLFWRRRGGGRGRPPHRARGGGARSFRGRGGHGGLFGGLEARPVEQARPRAAPRDRRGRAETFGPPRRHGHPR